MTFHYRYRKQIIITIIVVLIVSSLTITTIYFYEPKKEKKISSLKVKKTSNPIKEDTLNQKENKKYMVDIKGEVQTPGIYELESSSRVIDQTTPNMIQRINGIFERNPLISKGI